MTLVPVRLMRLPEAAEMAPVVLSLADRLSSVVGHAPDHVNESIARWLQGSPVTTGDTGPFHPDELAHELSAWMAPLASEANGDGRTPAECQVLRNRRVPNVDDVLAGDGRQFNDFLLLLHACVEPGRTGFRKATVASVPDKEGVGVLYAAPEHIQARLKAIHGHWARHVSTHPGFAATVAMTALMNLHPFMDGNGRVARILFHWTLNRYRLEPVCLPLHELSALSRCGYLVRLRQAQYHGEWEPLLAYLVMVAERWVGADTLHRNRL